jgi:hypothetical protein
MGPQARLRGDAKGYAPGNGAASESDQLVDDYTLREDLGIGKPWQGGGHWCFLVSGFLAPW